jgi:hypothetical protein
MDVGFISVYINRSVGVEEGGGGGGKKEEERGRDASIELSRLGPECGNRGGAVVVVVVVV